VSTPVSTLFSGLERRARCAVARPGVLVVVLYFILALIPNLPTWPGDPRRLPICTNCGGAPDIKQTVWFLEWTPEALIHGWNPFVTTYLNYPRGVNLAENTGIPLLGLLSAPITLLVSPIASMNLLRWLAFGLSASAAYFVLRKFVSYLPAAFIGGLLYGFSPYMVTQGGVHLDLMFVPFPPLILLGLFEIVGNNDANPVRWGLATGACMVAQFFISVEVLATTVLVAAIGILLASVMWFRDAPGHIRHAMKGLLLAAGITAPFVIYPIALMFHGPQHYVGPPQGYDEVFNADLLGAVVPTNAQLFAPKHLAQVGSHFVDGVGNIDENGTYLGLPLLALVAYFAVRFRRRREFVFLSALALVVYAFSLGPKLVVDGRVVRLPVGLPFRAISRVPGLDNILPVRLSLYVMFLVAAIVALGVDAQRKRLPHGGSEKLATSYRTGVGHIAIGLVVVLSIVALVPRWPYRSQPLSSRYARFAADLVAIPAGSVVLTYPYPTPFSDDAMLWQALTGMRFRLLGGYALIPGARGAPATGPAVLQPISVESLLVNSYAVAPVSGFPEIVATPYSIDATSVRVERSPSHFSAPLAGSAIHGTVSFIDPSARWFIVDVGLTIRVEVVVSSSTRYVDSGRHIWGVSELRRGELVSVSGNRAFGTVHASMLDGLRDYIDNNRVGAIVVELRKRDSAMIVRWVTATFGPPTRSFTGGVVWIRPSRGESLARRAHLARAELRSAPPTPDARRFRRLEHQLE